MTTTEERVAQILSPAIDVRAPYARQMIAQLVSLVDAGGQQRVAGSGIDRIADLLVAAAAERVVTRLSACINLTPDQAASIRRVACAITPEDRAELERFVGLIQRECLVDRHVKEAG